MAWFYPKREQVQAWRWMGDNLERLYDIEGLPKDRVAPFCDDPETLRVENPPVIGVYSAYKGFWIIRHRDGLLVTMPDHEFHRLYEGMWCVTFYAPGNL